MTRIPLLSFNLGRVPLIEREETTLGGAQLLDLNILSIFINEETEEFVSNYIVIDIFKGFPVTFAVEGCSQEGRP